jgi:hypothetical protein
MRRINSVDSQLVTLGALVTLFTLLFPTFVQQALGTNLQLLDRNGTSMFATALNYTIDQQPAQIFMGGYNFPDWLGECRHLVVPRARHSLMSNSVRPIYDQCD